MTEHPGYEIACHRCETEFIVPASGRYPCPTCGEENALDWYQVLIRDHGCEVCGVHEPGNEEWDWCDHETGVNCYWNDDAEDDEWDDDETFFNEDDETEHSESGG